MHYRRFIIVSVKIFLIIFIVLFSLIALSSLALYRSFSLFVLTTKNLFFSSMVGQIKVIAKSEREFQVDHVYGLLMLSILKRIKKSEEKNVMKKKRRDIKRHTTLMQGRLCGVPYYYLFSLVKYALRSSPTALAPRSFLLFLHLSILNY